MSDYTMRDAVQAAFDKNPSEFRDAIGSLLLDKIHDAVEIKKHSVAASFMSDEVEDEADMAPELETIEDTDDVN